MELPDHLIERLYAGAFPVAVWRNHLALTVNELASRAGVSPAALRRIEETKRLRGDECERLAAGLGISPCHLRQVRGRYRGCEDALAELGPRDSG